MTMTHNGHQTKAGHSLHTQSLITGTAAYFFPSLSLSNALILMGTIISMALMQTVFDMPRTTNACRKSSAMTYEPRSFGRGCAESCPAVQRATGPQSTRCPAISAGKVAMWVFGAKSCQEELAELPDGFKGWFCILSDNRSAVASSIIVYGKWLFWQKNIYPGIASAMVLWRSEIIRSLFKESLKWVMFP